MATLSVQITATGALGPSYDNVLQQLRILYWSIYGSDAILDPDSQDGQFLAALAQAIFDNCQSVIDVYNSFSPSKARGVGLSSLVKLNGLRRSVATNSEAVVTVGGTIGTQIVDGVVGDNANQNTRWAMPTLVTIPDSGAVDVTVTCTSAGAVTAAPGTLTEILTPTRGWQSVVNAAAAVLGQPVEDDAALRARQSVSVALPSLTILDGIIAAVEAIVGVLRLRVYENDDDSADADGIPPHAVSAVVSGGNVQEIAEAIALKKCPGGVTFGSSHVVVLDARGVPKTINFFQLSVVPIKMEITIHPLPGAGYISTTGDMLRQAMVNFVNSYLIGEDSYTSRLYGPANLGGVGLGATYVITSITQAKVGDALGTADVPILFNEGASIDLDHVTLTLV